MNATAARTTADRIISLAGFLAEDQGARYVSVRARGAGLASP